MPEEVSM
jgi:hypothetical protein